MIHACHVVGRSRALLVAAVLVATGCGHGYDVLLASGPPSALRGAPEVAVTFDYGTLRVERQSEASWVAEKSQDAGTVAGWNYRWQAKQVEPFRPISADLGGVAGFRNIALYQVDIQILRPERNDALWTMRGLGWRNGSG